jgi:predicted DNA-binding protein
MRIMKYRKDSQSKPIPVLLDETLRRRIAMMSERMGEPKSTVMRIAMRIGLESLEKALEMTPPKLSSLSYGEHQPQGDALNDPAPKKKKAT